jgi:hypothetical protein
VKSIRYLPRSIEFETITTGQETLAIRSAPREVTAGGKALARLNGWSGRDDGWFYESGRLRIRHRAPVVVIHFE